MSKINSTLRERRRGRPSAKLEQSIEFVPGAVLEDEEGPIWMFIQTFVSQFLMVSRRQIKKLLGGHNGKPADFFEESARFPGRRRATKAIQRKLDRLWRHYPLRGDGMVDWKQVDRLENALCWELEVLERGRTRPRRMPVYFLRPEAEEILEALNGLADEEKNEKKEAKAAEVLAGPLIFASYGGGDRVDLITAGGARLAIRVPTK